MRIVQLPEMLSEKQVYSVHCSWRDEIVTIVVVDDEGNSTVALPIIEPRSYTREFIMEQEWSIFAPEN